MSDIPGDVVLAQEGGCVFGVRRVENKQQENANKKACQHLPCDSWLLIELCWTALAADPRLGVVIMEV